MLPVTMMLALCGMLTYFIVSYILILGIEKKPDKFFGVKCGIIVLGIVCMFIIFRDMASPIFQELAGIYSRSSEIGITVKILIIYLSSCVFGYIGQRKEIKE